MMWEGKYAILLDEYLRNKVRLQELKILPPRYLTDEKKEEIAKLEEDIKIFFSMLGTSQLRSLLLMSLDIE